MISSLSSVYISGYSGIRCFSSSAATQGRIKKILKLAAEEKLDPHQLRRDSKEQKLRVPRKVKPGEERKVATLRTQKVAHELSKKVGEKVDYKTLGPTSNEDLKYFKQADKKTLYRLLGVSENQIQDSVVVSKTVEAFLKRDQGEKALTLAKLARENGSVAMNFIVSYFIKKGQFNDAIDLHVYRGKWGVKQNEYSLTTLFDEFSNYKAETPLFLGKSRGEKLKSFFLSSTRSENYQVNMIHFNSCMSALTKCVDQTLVFELLDKAEELGIKPDNKTYTIILQGLSFNENDVFAVGGAEFIYEKLLKLDETDIDNRVWESLAKVFITRERTYLIKTGVQILQKCFYITQDLPRVGRLFYPEPRNFEQLEVREFYGLNVKLKQKASTIDIAMLGALRMRDPKLAMRFFEDFAKSNEKEVDIVLFYKYMGAWQSLDSKNSAEHSIRLYKSLFEEKRYNNLRVDDLIKVKVFRGFRTQAMTNWEQKWKANRNNSRARVFFKLLESYMDMVDDSHSLRIYKGYLDILQYINLTKEEVAIVNKRLRVMENFYKENADRFRGFHENMLKTFNSRLKFQKKENERVLKKEYTKKLQ